MMRHELPAVLVWAGSRASGVVGTIVCFMNLALAQPTVPSSSRAHVAEEVWGSSPDGKPVHRYTLSNARGMTVRVISLGAIITEIRVPDRNGQFTNVVLGSDRLEPYFKGHPAAAAVIGRYANRIAGARFVLDGQEYKLAANNGRNHIHGGPNNFARAIWVGEVLAGSGSEPSVRFTYRSADLEEGFPGALTATVTYTLQEDNSLSVEYVANTDKPTVVNLTNHAYFNLAGAGDVLGHRLWLVADRYTPADEQLIPTGTTAPVRGTPLDFTTPTAIGARIDQLKPRPGGYDHNYVLGIAEAAAPRVVARVVEPVSGRVMEVLTTQPGVQLYTGNHVRDFVGTDGARFAHHGGLCLETQHFPDSPNQPQFPSTVLRPGETFRSRTLFRFSASRD